MKKPSSPLSISKAYLLLFFFLGIVAASCEEDNTYPSLIYDFVCMQTDDDGNMKNLLTDNGHTYGIEFSDSYLDRHDSVPVFRPDSIYRVVAMYELKEEKDSCRLYDLVNIYSKVPTPPTDDMVLSYDPVFLQSIRRSGEYLNIIIQLYSLNKQHYLGVIDTTEEGKAGVDFTLIHKNVDDAEAYRQRVYMSLPLKPFGLHKGDTIRFHANLYDEGMKSWEFIY
ncbi:MAG: hypothetical protein J5698_01130 [Bacteroidaceae bacterium]|nr:hypothetical protein [Bacteroidaceae bacterium]